MSSKLLVFVKAEDILDAHWRVQSLIQEFTGGDLDVSYSYVPVTKAEFQQHQDERTIPGETALKPISEAMTVLADCLECTDVVLIEGKDSQLVKYVRSYHGNWYDFSWARTMPPLAKLLADHGITWMATVLMRSY